MWYLIMRTRFIAVFLISVFPCFPASTSDIPATLQSVYERFSNKNDRQALETGLKFIGSTLDLIQRNHALEINDEKLVSSAIKKLESSKLRIGKETPKKVARLAVKAMLEMLDPHSSYFTPEAYKQFQVRTKGTFGGLGMEVTLDQETSLIKVIAPIDKTPAAIAGILAGDLISHLDDSRLKGLTLRKAIERMRGKPGSKIKLTVIRNLNVQFDVTIVRAVIRYMPVKTLLIGKSGYIRITRFNRRTNGGVRRAILNIQEKLGDDLQGIVLDLRNNPGGLLKQSVFVASAFLDGENIFSSRGRREGSTQTTDDEDGDLLNAARLVVLINGGSASASEIVAGALQDHGRAVIMGTRSFGKGSVQTIFNMKDNGALKITTAMYYLPSGRLIQKHGLTPDIRIAPEKINRGRREVDLKLALNSDGHKDEVAKHEIKEVLCPVAGKEKKDRILGCALLYLKSKDINSFLSQFKTK
jgi:carboxyl-terminal processing protease